jgi:hypothetical protein
MSTDCLNWYLPLFIFSVSFTPQQIIRTLLGPFKRPGCILRAKEVQQRYGLSEGSHKHSGQVTVQVFDVVTFEMRHLVVD